MATRRFRTRTETRVAVEGDRGVFMISVAAELAEMTAELGMNLAGVERVFELEGQLDRMTRRMEALERRAEQLEAQMAAEVEAVRREFRAEIVPYRAPGEALIPAKDLRRLRIPVRHRGS